MYIMCVMCPRNCFRDPVSVSVPVPVSEPVCLCLCCFCVCLTGMEAVTNRNERILVLRCDLTSLILASFEKRVPFPKELSAVSVRNIITNRNEPLLFPRSDLTSPIFASFQKRDFFLQKRFSVLK